MLILFCCLIGCGGSGPQLGTVEGSVTLDGKPLPGAIVSFRPVEGGRTAEGMTDESGHFIIEFAAGSKGALVGDHEIRVTTFREKVIGDNGRVEDPGMPEKVPRKYNDQSELIRTVEPGKNHFDLELASS
ncbi:carboxypeptidase regulatory-like domain-containing protein [Blastopirellula marina]|uniref:Carboxypeptidase regulatory-like domain-containing protein n=2 Tax=Pirellulales TaxID=2691354 RepID=A0A2S8FHN5_9BACT|nr:carboxypeptidase regulatory-like domain-containing protein [Blastopirellula marina]RCS51817.1 carboxypeptidase regulatory-like domain-containing protein [Bremerella cremea]